MKLRREASKAAEALSDISFGIVVEGIHGSTGEFTRIKYQGMKGYILTIYLDDVD